MSGPGAPGRHSDPGREGGARSVGEGTAYSRRTALDGTAAALARALPSGALTGALRAVWHRFLAFGDGPVAELPDGERIRLLPRHRLSTWNLVEYTAFRTALVSGCTALDVGANVGSYALLFGQWVGPTGRVFAFEPDPAAYDGLAGHIALNGLSAVVTPVPVAVSDAVGAATLLDDGGRGTSRLIRAGATKTPGSASPGAASGGSCVAPHPVETVTVDAFCARHALSPDLLKVDVEGAELEVLRGARETISRRGQRMALFVEFHPALWSERGLSAADLQTELRRQGLRAEPLRPGVDPWRLEGECVRLLPLSKGSGDA